MTVCSYTLHIPGREAPKLFLSKTVILEDEFEYILDLLLSISSLALFPEGSGFPYTYLERHLPACFLPLTSCASVQS